MFKDMLESIMEEVNLKWVYIIRPLLLNQCGAGK